MALTRFLTQAKDIAIERWDELYHPEGAYSSLDESKRENLRFVFRVSLFASYVFQSLSLTWVLYELNYVKSSGILGYFTAFSASPVLSFVVIYLVHNKSFENIVPSPLEKVGKIYLWTACTVSAIALAVLGLPLHGGIPLVFSFLSAIYCYKHYQSTYTLPPAAPKPFEEIPKITGEITDSALKERKNIDLTLFINETERLAEGLLAKIDLSGSNFDDRSLVIYIGHLFSKQSSSFYPHAIDLSHCPNIVKKGVSNLLTDFPNLTLTLTGTHLSSEDLYFLQKKNLAATLHFDTIGHDLLSLFQEGIFCDATFKVDQENIPFHEFILSGFGLSSDSKEYVITGISAKDFKQALRCLYTGIGCDASFKITCEGKETEVDLKKISPVTRLLHRNAAFSDVLLNVKGQKFPAHKAILSARSPYFKTMFTTKMKEKDATEVDLSSSLNLTFFKVYLEYLYTGTLPEISSNDMDICLKEATAFAGDSLDLIRLIELKQVRTLRGQKEENVADLFESHESSLLLREQFFGNFFEKQYGVVFSFEGDKVKTVTLKNLNLTPLAWLKSLLTSRSDLKVAIHLDYYFESKKRTALFALLHEPSIKALHLKGTWYDFLELIDLQLENKIEKIHITGEGKIDLSCLQRCVNLTAFTYPFSNTPVEAFFKFKKLKTLSEIRLPAGFQFKDLLEKLPDLKSVFYSADSIDEVPGWTPQLIGNRARKYWVQIKKKPASDFKALNVTEREITKYLKAPLKKLQIYSDWPYPVDSILNSIISVCAELKNLQIWSFPTVSLQKILKASPKLRKLTLNVSEISNLDFLLETPLQLKLLNLNSKIDEEILLKIVKICPCLKKLEISKSSFIAIGEVVINKIKEEYPRLMILPNHST